MFKPWIEKYYPLGFILLFFVVLLVPLRNLTLSPDSIAAGFYGRQQLIGRFNDFRLAIGDQVFPKVVAGKDDWLFFTAEGSMDDYQNSWNLGSRRGEIVVNLTALEEYLNARGIQLLVVVAPNKSTIYPEMMPDEIQVIGDSSRLDQVRDAFPVGGPVDFLDLRPALLSAKQERQVYFKTDTHWNDYGAYVAYAEILKRLAVAHPELSPHNLDEYKVLDRGMHSMDLAYNIGSFTLKEQSDRLSLKNGNRAQYTSVAMPGGRNIVFSRHPDATLPKALVFHDSFFFSVMPLLGEHFSRAVFVPHYSGDVWNLSWIEQEQPDIVIIEFAERYIHDIPRLVKPLD